MNCGYFVVSAVEPLAHEGSVVELWRLTCQWFWLTILFVSMQQKYTFTFYDELISLSKLYRIFQGAHLYIYIVFIDQQSLSANAIYNHLKLETHRFYWMHQLDSRKVTASVNQSKSIKSTFQIQKLNYIKHQINVAESINH